MTTVVFALFALTSVVYLTVRAYRRTPRHQPPTRDRIDHRAWLARNWDNDAHAHRERGATPTKRVINLPRSAQDRAAEDRKHVDRWGRDWFDKDHPADRFILTPEDTARVARRWRLYDRFGLMGTHYLPDLIDLDVNRYTDHSGRIIRVEYKPRPDRINTAEKFWEV